MGFLFAYVVLLIRKGISNFRQFVRNPAMREVRIHYTIPLFSLVSIVVIASFSLLSINNHDLLSEYEERQALNEAMIDAYYDSLKTEPAVPQDFLLKYNGISRALKKMPV